MFFFLSIQTLTCNITAECKYTHYEEATCCDKTNIKILLLFSLLKLSLSRVLSFAVFLNQPISSWTYKKTFKLTNEIVMFTRRTYNSYFFFVTYLTLLAIWVAKLGKNRIKVHQDFRVINHLCVIHIILLYLILYLFRHNLQML